MLGRSFALFRVGKLPASQEAPPASGCGLPAATRVYIQHSIREVTAYGFRHRRNVGVDLLLPLPEGAAWGGPEEAARLSDAILAALRPFRRDSTPEAETSAFKLMRMSPGRPRCPGPAA